MTYIAKIYKIVNTINNEIYVGSTRNELRFRWQGHKQAYNKKNNGLYLMMRKHGFEPFRIILSEEIEVQNRQEQLQHEQRYIDQLRPTLNNHNAYGTKCEHNRIRSECKDCGGSQICEHNRVRSTCKNCGGSQICEHNRRRSQCKDCGGSSICEHDRARCRCKDCNGSQICEHNKRQEYCKECEGSQVKLVYCTDCDIETPKKDYKRHINSIRHLHNTLPINL